MELNTVLKALSYLFLQYYNYVLFCMYVAYELETMAQMRFRFVVYGLIKHLKLLVPWSLLLFPYFV